MRILFYVHGFPYFHNTFIHNEIAGLARLGYDVRLRSAFNPNPDRVNSGVARFGLDARVRYLSADERTLLQPFWTAADLDRAWRDRAAGRGALLALPIVREAADCDVVHAAFGNGSATVAWVLSMLTGTPLTFEVHAYDLFVDFSHAAAKTARASVIFPETAYNRDYLHARHGVPLDRMIVKRLTFANADADATCEPRERDLVVSVGRLHPIKGFDIGLEAVARVAAERPRLRYVIAGDGPLRGALEARAAALGCADRVQFLGDIPNTEVLRWVARASVCLMPSVLAPDGDRDGIPTVLYEATYLGTPIVTSRISGIPELVRHKDTGWLAEPGDVAGVSAGLRWVLEDAARARAMAGRGRAWFDELFDAEEGLRVIAEGLTRATARPIGAQP